MTTSPSQEQALPSHYRSKQEFLSTLPPWRRVLATLNWRPVYDIEQETERLRVRSLESEKRLLESEKRLKLLESEDKRLAELESRLDALLLNADSSSQTPPATGSN